MNPPPKILAWVVLAGLVNAALLALLFLPVAPIVSLIIGIVAAGIAIAAGRGRLYSPETLRRRWRAVMRWLLGDTPTIAESQVGRREMLRYAVEIVFIVIVALYFTGQGGFLSPTLGRLQGHEAEWLTSYATFSADSLREYGYIPKWQPYFEWGEPFVTGPFSFVFNPFSIAPSLLLGGVQGINVSIALHGIIVAVGGWFLARVLGCGTLARILLALLFLGKGNMQAMIGSGYFQLGTSQAYFAWIIGGTLAILWLPGKRWPIVLTALSFTLMFWAGNLWYTLPMLLCIALLVVLYVWLVPGKVDKRALKRLALAGALTLGLSAVTLIPLWFERDYIGGHPNEIGAGAVMTLDHVIPLFFGGDMLERIPLRMRPDAPIESPHLYGIATFYYSAVVPLWFAALLLIPLHRPGRKGSNGVWLAGLLLLVMFTLWGAGGNPVFTWLYEHVPLLGQWRFVGRALAVASFWLTVLVALRVDGMWRAVWRHQDINRQDAKSAKGEGSQRRQWLKPTGYQKDKPTEGAGDSGGMGRYISSLRTPLVRLVLPSGMVLTCRAFIGGITRTQHAASLLLWLSTLLAAYQVNRNWGYVPVDERPSYRDEACISWLRDQYPERELTVYRVGYDAIYTYLNHHVREWSIEADYVPLALPDTVGNLSLIREVSLPEFALAWDVNERRYLMGVGYKPVPHTKLVDTHHCIWRKADALAYAYTVPLDDFVAIEPENNERLLAEDTTLVTTLARLPDEIALVVRSDSSEALLLTLQELAYPGWQVTLDGWPARLEVAGGQIAVLIPSDGKLHQVHFAFRPPLFYLGACVTLATALLSMGYLLRVERLIKRN